MKNNLENQDIKTDKPVPMSYEALKADRDAQQKRADALAVENAEMKDVLENICCRDNEPEYHDCGMGCGLEDRGITDRYRAMAHGWESAIERIYEEVIPFIEDLPETPATDAALAAIQARAKAEAFAEIIEFIDRRSGLAEMKTQWDLSSAIVAHIAELSRLLAHNIERAEAAEARLATPVQLPVPYSENPWMSPDPDGTWLDKEDVKKSIRDAGFTVEGDE
ncbi:hypothetical protein [Serratia entomophila]|uniref:hypothetical protein n=1 Tax=Serratia entomophila TaxID=42906 RepID=UPI00217AE730|nr:hypothetical protein [Serratia entomophila]CAI2147328.1 Uncharacterised protein [Serratia entomophila]